MTTRNQAHLPHGFIRDPDLRNPSCVVCTLPNGNQRHRVQTASLDMVVDVDRLLDMHEDGSLTAEQFVGAVRIALNRAPRDEMLHALIYHVSTGAQPVADLMAYVEDANARSQAVAPPS